MMIDDLPYRQIGDPRQGGIVCVVDHATNFVPDDIQLGISPELLNQHIAFDIGVEGIAGRMARRDGIAALGGVDRVELQRTPISPDLNGAARRFAQPSMAGEDGVGPRQLRQERA